MFKRIALALMFISAFSMASLVTPNTSEARWGWRRPYARYYYGLPRYSYYYGAPYRSYYRGWYGPRYYRPYYYGYRPYYYGYGPGAYYGPRGRVAFHFGY
jgi:hypothetical protein